MPFLNAHKWAYIIVNYKFTKSVLKKGEGKLIRGLTFSIYSAA